MQNIGAVQESLTVGVKSKTKKVSLQSLPKKHRVRNSTHIFR